MQSACASLNTQQGGSVTRLKSGAAECRDAREWVEVYCTSRRCNWTVFQSQLEKKVPAKAIVMTEAEEVASLDRVLTRLALTDEKDLEKVRCWPSHACHETSIESGSSIWLNIRGHPQSGTR